MTRFRTQFVESAAHEISSVARQFRNLARRSRGGAWCEHPSGLSRYAAPLQSELFASESVLAHVTGSYESEPIKKLSGLHGQTTYSACKSPVNFCTPRRKSVTGVSKRYRINVHPQRVRPCGPFSIGLNGRARGTGEKWIVNLSTLRCSARRKPGNHVFSPSYLWSFKCGGSIQVRREHRLLARSLSYREAEPKASMSLAGESGLKSPLNTSGGYGLRAHLRSIPVDSRTPENGNWNRIISNESGPATIRQC